MSKIHTTLIVATLAFVAIAAHSMPQGQPRWVTLATADGSVVTTPASSEAACRAAQSDTAVACLDGRDMRQVSDDQVVAAR
jgi:hypothetical protein